MYVCVCFLFIYLLEVLLLLIVFVVVIVTGLCLSSLVVCVALCLFAVAGSDYVVRAC